jgi:hypothetical protein
MDTQLTAVLIIAYYLVGLICARISLTENHEGRELPVALIVTIIWPIYVVCKTVKFIGIKRR